MPLYEFQHPKTREIIEVSQKMKECHVYIDDDGVEWKRIYNAPNAAIDTEMDAFSQKDWMRRTSKKGMTYGDMQDLSKELSNKREKSRGLDPVKNKTVKAYEKKTKKPHPNKNK
jgi:hypothetical protein